MHGSSDHLLYTNDEILSTISTKDVLEHFYAAKMFFIDACRGDQRNPGLTVPRGGKSVTDIIPAEGNWLLAYSTLPKHKSYEEQGKGGVWMSKLADKLRTADKSLADILTSASIPTLASSPGVNPERPQEAISPQQTTMNYKQQMNQFFQENGIDPKYEYLLDALCFRCIVRYVRHGVATEVDSVRYYTSKSDAKEQVAKLVLANENVVISKGSKGNTPPSKVWKSKLKEYCDKNRIVFSNSYQTVPSGNGFKSTVTFNGHVFEGEECKSKQEAEQSAAKRALQSV